MFSNYFNPISSEILELKNNAIPGTIGESISVFSDGNFPDFQKAEVAIFGINENRGLLCEESVSMNMDTVRKSLYSLYMGNWKIRILDLGDFKIGKELTDTYFAVTDLISNLISDGVVPIVIGGGQDLCYPIYKSYDSFNKGVNICAIDSKFDMISPNTLRLNSNNYLGNIIKEDPNHLNSFTNIGFQSYFVQKDEVHEMEKMFFETFRLGDFRQNIEEAEPYLRNSDLIIFDASSIKQSDSPGVVAPSPNGLFSHEACILSRYTGMSDRVSSFGIFEINSEKDINNQTSHLISQIIWYFLEGFSLRIGDFPTKKTISKNFKKYVVPLDEEDFQFIFYKSKLSGRWWISSVTSTEAPLNREVILPCSYKYYLDSVSGKIPARMMRMLKV